MQIEGPESSNVEDRRGMRGGRTLIGGGIGAVVIAVVAMLFGIDPRVVLGLLGAVQQVAPAPSQQQVQVPKGAPQDEVGKQVAKVLGQTERTWSGLFREAGGTYRNPVLVLYTGVTPTACGTGQSAMGPFYCPLDQKVYLDLAFFDEMARRYRAPGDFAQAYVLAHEVGHHVQNQLGIMNKAQQLRQRLSEGEYNQVSVRLELQADCFAGVWARVAQQDGLRIDDNDVREALAAAAAVGDDTIQRRTQGQVVPDAFTHGSAAQRMRWFQVGLQQGTIAACNTFDSRS